MAQDTHVTLMTWRSGAGRRRSQFYGTDVFGKRWQMGAADEEELAMVKMNKLTPRPRRGVRPRAPETTRLFVPNKQVRALQAFRTLTAAGVIAAAALAPVAAADISGAGATFPYPVYAKWADAYKKETGVGLNYQSIGSGGGIKQIQAKTVTFGASDMPLKAADLDKSGLVQFPMVMGGVVPVINVEGVKPGELTLDGVTLAKIFLGEIKTWNDAAIQKLNAGVKLPSQPIVVVHRSDGSGTTFLFTDYASKVSADWKSKVGANTAVEWPVGIGAKGNEGVANNVAQTKGSIGYVEYAYAKQNKLNYARM